MLLVRRMSSFRRISRYKSGQFLHLKVCESNRIVAVVDRQITQSALQYTHLCGCSGSLPRDYSSRYWTVKTKSFQLTGARYGEHILTLSRIPFCLARVIRNSTTVIRSTQLGILFLPLVSFSSIASHPFNPVDITVLTPRMRAL